MSFFHVRRVPTDQSEIIAHFRRDVVGIAADGGLYFRALIEVNRQGMIFIKPHGAITGG